MEDAEEDRSALGDLRTEHKLGWHLFDELVNQTWLLLPGSLKGQNDNPVEGWYALVYDRLSGTSLVKQWRNNDDEFRGLTANSFKASATVIELLFKEWDVSNSTSPVASAEDERIPDPNPKDVLKMKGNSRLLFRYMWKRDNVTLDELREVLHAEHRKKNHKCKAPSDKAVKNAVEYLERKLSEAGLTATKVEKNGGMYYLRHPQK
jgi:hypothetical protein